MRIIYRANLERRMKTRYITAKRAREEGERGRPHKQAWHDIDQDQRGVAPILLPLPPALIWVTMMKTDCCFVGRSFAPSWACVKLLEQLFSPLLKMSQGEIDMTQFRGVSVRDLGPDSGTTILALKTALTLALEMALDFLQWKKSENG